MTDDEELTDEQKLQLQRMQEIVRKQEKLVAEADKISDPKERQKFLLAGWAEISADRERALGRKLTESERATANANAADTLRIFAKYGPDAVQRVIQGPVEEIKRLSRKKPE